MNHFSLDARCNASAPSSKTGACMDSCANVAATCIFATSLVDNDVTLFDRLEFNE